MTPKVCGGLVVVDPTKLAAVAGHGVDQIALKVPWSSVNPSNGTYDWSFIDNALSTYPDARFTLRIQSGNSAPSWLTALTGTVEVYLVSRSQTAFVPHFWEEVAMQAWDDMIHAAGARYDTNPRVVMVSADAPMVVYSEPYILGSDQASGARLFTAGLNQTTRISSITRCVDDTAHAFPNTLVELAIHGDLQIPVSGGMIFSWPIGRQLAIDLATAHGKHLVLSDYGLGLADPFSAHAPEAGETLSNTADVYTFMHLRTLSSAGAAQGPITFQLTVGREPQTQATYEAAAQNAADLGAWQCETSGWGLLGSSAPTHDAALKTNATEGWPIDNAPVLSTTPPEPVGVCTGGNDGGDGPTANQALTLPAGAVAGDVAIVKTVGFTTTHAVTVSSASAEVWTLLSGPDVSASGTNYREYLWSKVLAASDLGSPINVTWASTISGVAVGVVYPKGCTVNPPPNFTAVLGGTTSITPTAVTASTGDAVLLFATAKVNSGATPATATLPSGMVLDKAVATARATGTNFGVVAAHQPVTTGGSVGGSPVTYSTATNGASAYTLTISPPPIGLPVRIRSAGAWVDKRLVIFP